MKTMETLLSNFIQLSYSDLKVMNHNNLNKSHKACGRPLGLLGLYAY